jgi:prepilin-type N-terminal cleavage/methylation domain-containing protein
VKKLVPNNKGFTLIEVLIAITVLAFLMLGVYTIISGSVDTKDRVLSEDRSFVQVMRAFDRVQGDIAQAWSPLYAHAKYNETAERARARSAGQEFKPIPFQASERFPFQSVTKQPVPAIVQDGPSELVFFTAANRRKLQDTKQSRYAWVRHSLRPYF